MAHWFKIIIFAVREWFTFKVHEPKPTSFGRFVDMNQERNVELIQKNGILLSKLKGEDSFKLVYSTLEAIRNIQTLESLRLRNPTPYDVAVQQGRIQQSVAILQYLDDVQQYQQMEDLKVTPSSGPIPLTRKRAASQPVI